MSMRAVRTPVDSVKPSPERNGISSALTRPSVAASADELRGLRKLCQLQCPCVEFVLDSLALELRVLGLIFGVEDGVAGSFHRTSSNMHSLV